MSRAAILMQEAPLLLWSGPRFHWSPTRRRVGRAALLTHGPSRLQAAKLTVHSQDVVVQLSREEQVL